MKNYKKSGQIFFIVSFCIFAIFSFHQANAIGRDLSKSIGVTMKGVYKCVVVLAALGVGGAFCLGMLAMSSMTVEDTIELSKKRLKREVQEDHCHCCERKKSTIN